MSKGNQQTHSQAKGPPKPWVAWNIGKGTVRVQVHDPHLAKAFKKEKDVEQVGYAVGGGYMRIFSVKKPVEWVARWMSLHATKGEGSAENK